MEPNQEKCPHCGASMKSYWHSLTPGLVSVLVKAIQHVHRTGRNKFHYKDLNLNYSEASNLQKLRLHGLITHFDKDSIKSGEWLVTTRGGQFLRGEIAVPQRVQTFRNKVLDHSQENIHISTLRGKIPYFEREFAYEVPRESLVLNTSTLF